MHAKKESVDRHRHPAKRAHLSSQAILFEKPDCIALILFAAGINGWCVALISPRSFLEMPDKR